MNIHGAQAMRVDATVPIAVAPEPEHLSAIRSFLWNYWYAVNYIIDLIWPQALQQYKVPSQATVRKKVYQQLKQLGYRSHHIDEIVKRAIEIVKSVINKCKKEKKERSECKKPRLRKLTARLSYYDYDIDLQNRVLTVYLRNGEKVQLKITDAMLLKKYTNGRVLKTYQAKGEERKNWTLGTLTIKYRTSKRGDREELRFLLSLKKEVEEKKPKHVIGVDINVNNITLAILDLDGNLISIYTIPYTAVFRALVHRKLAENMQRRYGQHIWNLPFARDYYRYHRRRSRNITEDSSHYLSKRIAEIADEYDAVVVFEDLRNMKRNKDNKSLNWLISHLTYRKMQRFTEYKVARLGLKTVYVSPKDTSRTDPYCGTEVEHINYRWVKLCSGIITTRDVIASINIARRGLEKLKKRG